MSETTISSSPDETFEIGEALGGSLSGGEVVLLYGGLGAGKTLFTKGILSALGFDPAEVTSPSFALVNRYPAEKFDVFHVDLWRLDKGGDVAFAVGLDEIFAEENAVAIIEWAERLGNNNLPPRIIRVTIEGDGELPRKITVTK